MEVLVGTRADPEMTVAETSADPDVAGTTDDPVIYTNSSVVAYTISYLRKFEELFRFVANNSGFLRRYVTLDLTKILEKIEQDMLQIQKCLYFMDVERDILRCNEAIAYDLLDTLELLYWALCVYNGRKGFFGCLQSWTTDYCTRLGPSFNLVLDLNRIETRLRELKREVVRLPSSSTRSHEGNIWDKRIHSFHLDDDDEDQEKLVGFETYIEGLSRLMLNDAAAAEAGAVDLQEKDFVTSIYGMAGLGKTALAKKVYKSVKHRFDCSAMVFVSANPNKHQILQDVAKQVGLLEMAGEEKEILDDNLEANLHAYLEDKRYVILLDDIWNSQVWDLLPLPVGDSTTSTGSRIITTSRCQFVGSPIGWEKIISVDIPPLDENECLDLFCKKMGIESLNSSNALENVAKEIVRSSGGVPLAIMAMAEVLLREDATEDHWHKPLERMGHNDMFSRAFAFSYKDLHFSVKSCLLYLGLFPEGYCFSASDIINKWQAECFFPSGHEDEGDNYLNHLEATSMIQVSNRRFDGRIKTFRVHDIVHRFFHFMTTETNFLSTRDTSIPSEGTRRIISNWREISFQSATLRTALSFHEGVLEMQPAEEFSRGSKLLRVLAVGSKQLPSFLQKAVGNFKLLKYLGTTVNSWHQDK